MKKIFIGFLLLIGLFLYTACRKQQTATGDPQTTPASSNSKPSPETEQRLQDQADKVKEDAGKDEVETPQGKVKIWTVTTKHKTDSIKNKDKLFYQLRDEKPVLIAATRWDGYFKSLSLSPNGKWAVIWFQRDVSGLFDNLKSSEIHLLVNLDHQDFLMWDDLEKRLGKLIDKNAEYKQINLYGWEAGKPATVTYKKGFGEAKEATIDLPDKLPTPKQNLYQAIGIN